METSSEVKKCKIIDSCAAPAVPYFFDKIPEIIPLILKAKGDVKKFNKGLSKKTHFDLVEKSGISEVILGGFNRPYQEVISNDSVNEFVQTYPEKFHGLVSVDLYDPVQACKTIDKYVTQYGFKGVKIFPWLWNLPPNTNLYYPIFVKCIDLNTIT